MHLKLYNVEVCGNISLRISLISDFQSWRLFFQYSDSSFWGAVGWGSSHATQMVFSAASIEAQL